MRTKFSRILSLLLSAAMICSLFCTPAFAASSGANTIAYKLHYNGMNGRTGALECTRTVGNHFTAGDALVYGFNTNGYSDAYFLDLFKNKNSKENSTTPNNEWTKEDWDKIKKFWSETTSEAGYAFTGWYTDPHDGTEVDCNAIIGKDIEDGQTLYAHWTKDGTDQTTVVPDVQSFTIGANGSTFHADGSETATVSITDWAPKIASVKNVQWSLSVAGYSGTVSSKTNDRYYHGINLDYSGNSVHITCNTSGLNDTADRVVTVTATIPAANGGAATSNSVTVTFNHHWQQSGKSDATCNQAGSTSYKCADCTATKTESSGKALGHDYQPAGSTDATCTAAKTNTVRCSRCGLTKTETEGSPLGHDYQVISVKEPTCTENGAKKKVCQRCGVEDLSFDGRVIPALGHQYGPEGTCTVCGEAQPAPAPEGGAGGGGAGGGAGGGGATDPAGELTPEPEQPAEPEPSPAEPEEKPVSKPVETPKPTPAAPAQQPQQQSKPVEAPKQTNVVSVQSTFEDDVSAKSHSFTIPVKQTGDAKLTFKSNNKSVKVNSNGKVTINKNFIGKAVITVSAPATEDYKATTKKVSIVVNPTTTNVAKVNGGSKKVTVNWKKDKLATGYQISYSTNKNFKKGVKTVTVKKASATSQNIKNLKKNTKYYVRMRTYTKVGKTNFYSDWSGVKTVKTAKK